MKFTSHELVLQEVPGEVCLAFSVSNCPFRCAGCHSAYLQTDVGTILTLDLFTDILDSYKVPSTGNYPFTCILFFGGEQHEEEFRTLLEYSQYLGLKTCLYTGANDVPTYIKANLNYLKTGPYLSESGSLLKSTTNQRLLNLDTNTDITYKFWEN